MATSITVTGIYPLQDTIEVDVTFEEEGPRRAKVTVFVEDRDWLLSDLKADAIEKAKAFVSHAASSRQN